MSTEVWPRDKNHPTVKALLEMEDEKSGPPISVKCDRCDRPTESPPIVAVQMCDVVIGPCLLCLDCRRLSVVDMPQLGRTGWLRCGGKTPATWEGMG
jgi:hypothetical protein